ncbi:hypothetical protein LEP1GSC126_0106 [Leptospira kirschneri str. 200801774]|nr:hypothetical protein LEP1GSC126_0106 [Leptospira kirschneri str. 200801774]
MVKKDQTSSRHIRNLSNEQKNSKLITDKKIDFKKKFSIRSLDSKSKNSTFNKTNFTV